jgi:hypothetical protein
VHDSISLLRESFPHCHRFFLLPVCTITAVSPAMVFDWQTELASTVKPPSIVVEPVINNPPPKSFAQALAATTMSDNSASLPTPIIRGETLCIQISQETYARGVEVCKRNLRGRVLLNKGDKPYGSREVLTKLQQLWTNIGPWKMTPLAKEISNSPLIPMMICEQSGPREP